MCAPWYVHPVSTLTTVAARTVAITSLRFLVVPHLDR